MASLNEIYMRPQLVDRQDRLHAALTASPGEADLARLLGEVDAALARLDGDSYGYCETCHDPIEPERLLANPLLRFCLDHLSEAEQRELEQDLVLASRIQRSLLPPPEVRAGGWEARYHWEPAGLVSGDYCDIVQPGEDGCELLVLFGDVAGKGVAASILMAHLHATFRSLLALDGAVDRLVERANRVFRESALSPYFATLVCARAGGGGDVDICNAGHCPPVILSGGEARTVEPTGLPVGTFYSTHYGATRVHLAPGDTLVLYTDGLTEACDRDDHEYGAARLASVLARHQHLPTQALLDACLADLAGHLGGAPRTDDLTLMALRRLA